MLNATYNSKDQNFQNESTTYWFDVDGETYGVVHSGPEQLIVDCESCPVNTDDSKNTHLEDLKELVTEEMIMDF